MARKLADGRPRVIHADGDAGRLRRPVRGGEDMAAVKRGSGKPLTTKAGTRLEAS
jgi:hypothetical protein